MKKWSLIADYHYSVRRAEMESFFSEAKDSAIPEDEIIKYKDKIIYTDNTKQALNQARLSAAKDDMVLITGSFYIIGELLKAL